MQFTHAWLLLRLLVSCYRACIAGALLQAHVYGKHAADVTSCNSTACKSAASILLTALHPGGPPPLPLLCMDTAPAAVACLHAVRPTKEDASGWIKCWSFGLCNALCPGGGTCAIELVWGCPDGQNMQQPVLCALGGLECPNMHSHMYMRCTWSPWRISQRTAIGYVATTNQYCKAPHNNNGNSAAAY
jgi:hypothetical protein